MLTTAAGVVLGGLVLCFLLGTDVGRVILVLGLGLLALAGTIVVIGAVLLILSGPW